MHVFYKFHFSENFYGLTEFSSFVICLFIFINTLLPWAWELHCILVLIMFATMCGTNSEVLNPWDFTVVLVSVWSVKLWSPWKCALSSEWTRSLEHWLGSGQHYLDKYKCWGILTPSPFQNETRWLKEKPKSFWNNDELEDCCWNFFFRNGDKLCSFNRSN